MKPLIRLSLCALSLALLATAGCARRPPSARPETASVPAAQGAGDAEKQPEARAVLLGMAEYLSKAPRFSVNVASGYDVVQESGQKIEFGERRKVTVLRPDRLRVEVEQSDGDKSLVLFDGREITVFSPNRNVFAQATHYGGIDDAVAYLLKDLHMRLPLALLLVSKLPAELERRVQAVDYVEKTAIHGRSAHHLAARTETVDFQVWVAEGEEPLPLRVVLTYKHAVGQPQYHANFSDWIFAPEAPAASFAFTPPAGAQKIDFLARISRAGARAEERQAPMPEGGEK